MSVMVIGSRGQCPAGRIATHLIAYACTLYSSSDIVVEHAPSQRSHNSLVSTSSVITTVYWWGKRSPYPLDAIATALFCLCTWICANTARVKGDGSILLAIASVSVRSYRLRVTLSLVSVLIARWVYLPDMWSCARAFSLASSIWLCRFGIHWGAVTAFMFTWWAYVCMFDNRCDHVFDAVPDALPAIAAVLLCRCRPCLMLCVMSCVV